MASKGESVLDANDIAESIRRISDEILSRGRCGDIAIIGIKARGEILARRIADHLGEVCHEDIPVGAVDIALYRDDLGCGGGNPEVRGTEIDFDVNGKDIVLVDDVLYTGRTVRAALDQIIDFGRPKRIQLAVLIDRGRRELPIAADYVGKSLEVGPRRRIEVHLRETDGEDEVVIKSSSS
ncbi:MAG: bifunctional pyr operon transcriptional regulator/uracil phosphoribosyltransferase PyrR [Planctomycetes bacterium]|nr:bifunctional pyr operon transcriptional regulator/uracil phosphoribosyltransferase PyrR [Planctomycetota bacterium]